MTTRHNNLRPALAKLLTATTLTVLVLAQSGNASQIIDTPLNFSTTGQPLFGGDSGGQELIDVELPFFEEHIPQTTRGRIERVSEEVPLSTLQSIWQRAIDTCTGYSYTVPVIGTKISPTQSECISGTVRRNYCTLPPQLGWTYCPSWFRETYTKNVGPGIGPRPTRPAQKAFDLGAIVTFNADVEMGVRGQVLFDPGTVDVSFDGDARLEASVDQAAPGDIVTIDTTWAIRSSSANMESRYPNIDFSIGSYVFTDINATIEYAAPDVATGDQVRGKKVLYDANTLNSDLENVGADGIVEFANTEWFGVNVSPAGLEVRVLEEGVTVATGKTLLKGDVLFPFQPKPRPIGAAGFSLADYSLLSPKLDTPAPNGFDCGDCLNPPYRNFVNFEGQIVNSTPVGQRTLIGGLIGEGGIESPVVNNGLQDGDFFRFDLDVDSISLAVGVPLGVIFEGPQIKLPKRIFKGKELGPIIATKLDAVDLDVASFWSADQSLTFDPRVSVDLNFDKTVDVRLEGEAEFTARSRVTVTLGEKIEFVQVEGGVRVTPVFSARNNQFTNDTSLLVTLAYQQTIGGFELYGMIPDLAGTALGMPLSFAISQVTPQFADPLTLWSSQPDPENLQSYGLGGFRDVTGGAFSIGDSSNPTPPPGGNGGNGGNGGTGGNAQSGGGGGAAGLPELIVLAGLFALLRRRRM